MSPITMIIGIIAIIYGVATFVFRIKYPERFEKLEAMKKSFGNKNGIILHTIAYTLIPIVVGLALLLSGSSGK